MCGGVCPGLTVTVCVCWGKAGSGFGDAIGSESPKSRHFCKIQLNTLNVVKSGSGPWRDQQPFRKASARSSLPYGCRQSTNL